MTTRDLKVSIEEKLAARIETEVRAGHFPSINNYISEAAARMLDEGAAVEAWLQASVVEGYREYIADPMATVPAEQIMHRLRDRRSRH